MQKRWIVAHATALVLAAASAHADPEQLIPAVLNVGTATISGSGTTYTNDPSNSGFDSNANDYLSVTVVSGAALTLQGYPALTEDDALTSSLAQIGGVIGGLVVLPGGVANIQGGAAGAANGVRVSPLGTLNLSAGQLFSTQIGAGATFNMTAGVVGADALTGLQVYGTANLFNGYATIKSVVGNGVVNLGGTTGNGSYFNGQFIPIGIFNNGTINVASVPDQAISFQLFDDGTLDLFGTFAGEAPGTVIGPGVVGSVTGTLAYDDLPSTISFDTTQGGKVEFNVGTFPLQEGGTPVPEPGSLQILAVAVLGIIGIRRRREIR